MYFKWINNRISKRLEDTRDKGENFYTEKVLRAKSGTVTKKKQKLEKLSQVTLTILPSRSNQLTKNRIEGKPIPTELQDDLESMSKQINAEDVETESNKSKKIEKKSEKMLKKF